MSRRVKKGRMFTDPESKIEGTAKFWAQRLKMSAHGFRVRARLHGKDNPRTYKDEDLRKDRGACMRRDTKVYESPCGKYKGTPGKISKQLGIKRAVFIRRVRDWGANNPKTYRTKKEALAVRGLNIQKAKAAGDSGNLEWASLSGK